MTEWGQVGLGWGEGAVIVELPVAVVVVVVVAARELEGGVAAAQAQHLARSAGQQGVALGIRGSDRPAAFAPVIVCAHCPVLVT